MSRFEMVFDDDGVTTLRDLALLQANMGSSVPSPAAAASQESIPEPTTLTLAALGLIGCAVRWRRGRRIFSLGK